LWGAAQKETSKWNDLADNQRFIVVYPSGLGGKGLRVWRVEPGPDLMKDVRFISELIDTLKASYNIDSTRIYANGLSNGGGMSFVLSCTLSDRIAAVGMVAAAQTLPWSWCTDHRAVPMIAFHGTSDPVIPYNGGSSWISPRSFPNTPGWAANWARRNRCDANAVDSAVAVDVTRRAYANCADGADVVLYTVQGGGHTWPGGTPLPEWFVGPTTRSVDATSLMWSFFVEHPLVRK
jgi:polyhydroxybutyrate depolymerase